MIYLLDFIGDHIVITTLRNVKKNSGEWLKVKRLLHREKSMAQRVARSGFRVQGSEFRDQGQEIGHRAISRKQTTEIR
jgi:hypothetical protein